MLRKHVQCTQSDTEQINDMTTFGIEIEINELRGHNTHTIAAALNRAGVNAVAEEYNHHTRTHWKVITDGSCGTGGGTGIEIVSPVLDPRTGDDCWNDIVKVCGALNDLGAKVNRNCGLHVHFHVANMAPKNVASFVARYIRNEHFIDMAMPESRRRNNNQYCRSNMAGRYGTVPTDADAYMQLANGYIEQLRGVRTFANLIDVVNRTERDRYMKINMLAFTNRGTIEVRHAAGTTNAKKICMWVRFLLSMLKESNRSSYVRNQTAILLTPDRAWGAFWRYDDQPAIRWFLGRMRKLMRASGMDAEDNANAIAA